MIEAMACGTPVIAFRRGSAPEVIDDGVSGFLVDDVPKPARPRGGSLNSIARRPERLSNDASTLNERLANTCKSIVGSFARKRLAGTGNEMVSHKASPRVLSVAIGPFWPKSAQKFRMRRRWTDASRPFRCKAPSAACESIGVQIVEHGARSSRRQNSRPGCPVAAVHEDHEVSICGEKRYLISSP